MYALLLFFPLYIVLITSFTSVEEITSTTSFIWWPKNFTFSSYGNIFTGDIYAESLGAPTLLISFWNTMWMTLIPLIVGLVVSGLSAFAFAKIKFPGREKLFRFAFILSTVPLGALSVISYTFFSMLGWTGTPLPIIVPGLFGSMTTVFFLKMYYEGIPDSVIEAARIDGLSTIGTFVRIVFPLALPAFVAQFIFGFVGRYNNYLMPLLYLDGDMQYITLQLYLHSPLYPTIYPQAMPHIINPAGLSAYPWAAGCRWSLLCNFALSYASLCLLLPLYRKRFTDREYADRQSCAYPPHIFRMLSAYPLSFVFAGIGKFGFRQGKKLSLKIFKPRVSSRLSSCPQRNIFFCGGLFSISPLPACPWLLPPFPMVSLASKDKVHAKEKNCGSFRFHLSFFLKPERKLQV